MADPAARSVALARYAVIAIGALLLGAMAYVVFVYRQPVPEVQARLTEVQVGNPRSILVTLQVEKAPLAEAACQVTAFDADGKSAGRLVDILIGPRNDAQRVTTTQVEVPTEAPASDAAVATCAVTRTR